VRVAGVFGRGKQEVVNDTAGFYFRGKKGNCTPFKRHVNNDTTESSSSDAWVLEIGWWMMDNNNTNNNNNNNNGWVVKLQRPL